MDNFTQTVQVIDLKFQVDQIIQTDFNRNDMFSQTIQNTVESKFSQTDGNLNGNREDFTEMNYFSDIFHPQDELLSYQNENLNEKTTEISNSANVKMNKFYENFSNNFDTENLYGNRMNQSKGNYRNKNLLYEDRNAGFDKFFLKNSQSENTSKNYKSKF